LLLQVRIYVQRGKRKDGGVSFIRIEARLDTGTPAGETESQTADVIEDLWSVLLPVLEDVDSLLATCAGALNLFN
jgi:hypothetical protein